MSECQWKKRVKGRECQNVSGRIGLKEENVGRVKGRECQWNLKLRENVSGRI